MSQDMTTSQEVQADEAKLNALLSGEEPSSDGGEETPASETETSGDTTEATETETADEGAEEAAETEADEAEEEPADETADEEAEEEPSELTLGESDRDYSAAAYEKAAKHYSRTHGVQLNPEDPAHRALLKEVMDRGEALKRQREERETAETKKADEASTADADKTKTELSPEQRTANITQFIQNVSQVAKSRVVPEVAMYTAKTLGGALAKLFWPERFKSDTPAEDRISLDHVTQEQANEFTQAVMTLQYLSMEDMGPMLYGTFRDHLGTDPVWGTVQREAIDASAFEHLETSLGAERFADMEKLVTDGTLKEIMNKNPNVFKNIVAGDGNNPVLNQAARFDAAYKFARGEKTLEQVSRAVQTGKKQATDNAKKVAASRVAAGNSRGGFSKGPSEGQKLVSDITSGGGSKFSKAVQSQLKR